jgi:hypothetical protein
MARNNGWKAVSSAACFALLVLAAGGFARAQQPDPAMNHRGDHVMGFSHEKTTHHFFLTKDGGAIQVQANDPNDSASLAHIRMHLEHIAKSFAAGDFDDPMETHAQVPPGVPVMKKRKDKISYRFEPIDNGGKVVIRSNDRAAVAAVHEFLQFQIRAHKTGDPLEVQ